MSFATCSKARNWYLRYNRAIQKHYKRQLLKYKQNYKRNWQPGTQTWKMRLERRSSTDALTKEVQCSSTTREYSFTWTILSSSSMRLESSQIKCYPSNMEKDRSNKRYNHLLPSSAQINCDFTHSRVLEKPYSTILRTSPPLTTSTRELAANQILARATSFNLSSKLFTKFCHSSSLKIL